MRDCKNGGGCYLVVVVVVSVLAKSLTSVFI